ANFDEDTFGRKSIPAYSIPTPERGAPPAETVIGQVRPYRIRKGDTLIDLARYYDLGYNEIVDANPGIDPWEPPAAAPILLATHRRRRPAQVHPRRRARQPARQVPPRAHPAALRHPRDRHPLGGRDAGEPRLRASLPGGHRAPVPAGAGRRSGRVRLPAGQGRRARRRGLPGDAPGHLRLRARGLWRGAGGGPWGGARRPW